MDDDLAEEQALLKALETATRQPISASVGLRRPCPLLDGADGRLAVLLRAFKRKRTEAAMFRLHLAGIREFLRGGWDEEAGYFCSIVAPGADRLRGHWCPALLEELDEILDPDIIWTPR